MGLNNLTTGGTGGLRPPGLKNLSEISAIPDSEADQKLRHRWVLDDDSPFTDSAGSSDAANNGTTKVTGDYAGGAARQGNGTDDYISLGPLGSFGSDMSNDFAIAITLDISDPDDATFIGAIRDDGGNGNTWLGFRDINSSGNISARLRGESSGDPEIETTSGDAYAGDDPSRIVFNKITNDPSNWEIWKDGTKQDVSVENTESLADPADFDIDVTLHARNTRGTIERHSAAVEDDVCIYTDSLTQTEIESYDNPWE